MFELDGVDLRFWTHAARKARAKVLSDSIKAAQFVWMNEEQKAAALTELESTLLDEWEKDLNKIAEREQWKRNREELKAYFQRS